MSGEDIICSRCKVNERMICNRYKYCKRCFVPGPNSRIDPFLEDITVIGICLICKDNEQMINEYKYCKQCYENMCSFCDEKKIEGGLTCQDHENEKDPLEDYQVLPICENPYNDDDDENIIGHCDMHSAMNNFNGLVGADCWAVVLKRNGEKNIKWNGYKNYDGYSRHYAYDDGESWRSRHCCSHQKIDQDKCYICGSINDLFLDTLNINDEIYIYMYNEDSIKYTISKVDKFLFSTSCSK